MFLNIYSGERQVQNIYHFRMLVGDCRSKSLSHVNNSLHFEKQISWKTGLTLLFPGNYLVLFLGRAFKHINLTPAV